MRRTFQQFLALLTPLFTLALLLSACENMPAWEDVKSDVWWHDAVFYQIFVRSFADSDGDGIGDFKGLTSKLDYLNDGKTETDGDLGINAIWLMPIQPSPSYHGYDVLDYYAVNSQYGTMEDFKALIAEAHKRDIRVIIDFVINHTSDQHPWFQASARQEEPYTDWYIWSDEDPGYQGPWNETVWHAFEERFYYGVFVKEMPDLNYGSDEVTAEIEKIAAFWLNDVGVDGFRVDGAKHLLEENRAQENTPATHAWFKEFHADFKAIKPEAILVGEIWSPADQAAQYVNNGELDLVFNFPLADDILSGVTFKDGKRVGNTLNQHERVYQQGRYASFLANHDQARVMTKIAGDIQRGKHAATLLLTAPGTPFLYYGEEIGMSGDKPDPNIRTPMQWSPDANGGFTSGTPWKAINGDVSERNVQTQDKDADSLLNHYRDLIHLRQNHYALREGQYVQVLANNNRVFAMLRVAEKETILVLVNLDDGPISDPRLKWNESALRGTYQPTLLMSKGSESQVKLAPFTVDEKGAIENYQPMAEIPGNSTIVIQFRP